MEGLYIEKNLARVQKGSPLTNQMIDKAFRVFPTAFDTTPLIGQDLLPEISNNCIFKQ